MMIASVPSAIRFMRKATPVDGFGTTASFGVSRRLKSEVVIDSLGLKIVSGELAPGEILPTEADLAESLGLSRPSLREDLRALAIKGLVRARSSVMVSSLAGSRVDDRCQNPVVGP